MRASQLANPPRRVPANIHSVGECALTRDLVRFAAIRQENHSVELDLLPRDRCKAGNRRAAGAVECTQGRRVRRRALSNVGRSLTGASRSSTLASPMRLSMQIAPCPGAGGKVRESRISVSDIDLAEAFQAGKRQQGRIDLALFKLAQAGFDKAAEVDDLMSGRMRRISAWRRSDEEPTVAPCGRSISFRALAADDGVAEIFAPGRSERCSPSGRIVAMSLAECTAKSSGRRQASVQAPR